MFVHESGSPGSPAIVFLHGNGANGTMWKTHMEQLADFHCLAPDFPGFGQSGDTEWASLGATTDGVISSVRERTSQARVHILGLSLGGSVALTWLAVAPDMVDYAIIDGAGVRPVAGLPLMRIGFRLMQPFLHTHFVIRTIANMTNISEGDYPGFRRGMLATSPSSFRRSFLEAAAMQRPSGLDRVEGRTLFVAGEREPEAVRQSQAELARLMRNAACYVAPGMGHGWLAEAPDLHCRMVRAWLRDEEAPEELVKVC
jgi:pimeloyl-ACP methyl ester carboxylesterase